MRLGESQPTPPQEVSYPGIEWQKLTLGSQGRDEAHVFYAHDPVFSDLVFVTLCWDHSNASSYDPDNGQYLSVQALTEFAAWCQQMAARMKMGVKP